MKKQAGKAAVLFRLLRLVKPLTGYMLLAITMGTLGFLCAQFIPLLGGFALLSGLGFAVPLSLGAIWALLPLLALLRAVLRYTEQRTGHYIAFTLCFRPCGGSVRQSWRVGTRGTSSPSSPRTWSFWRSSTPTPWPPSPSPC